MEELGRLQSMGVAKSRTRLSDFAFTFCGLSLFAVAGGYSVFAAHRLLVVASLITEHRLTVSVVAVPWLYSTGSVVAAHGLSCPMPCEIFPGQGLNPYPLHWQADSYPLDHQGHSFAFSAVGVLWIQSILISRHCLGQFRLL